MIERLPPAKIIFKFVRRGHGHGRFWSSLRCIHSSTVGVPLGTTALVADDDNAFPDPAQSSSATAVGAPLPALELSPRMMSFPTPRSDGLPTSMH
jgi:hypothetical protein